ncbi:hypothetical protein 015DV004_264 [Bacillus phage 015DV004]|nr:hypothetical protein 015DV004_264 [Bacillus phage 015DV004]
MEKIRRNAVRYIKDVLNNCNQVEYFVKDNNYQGGTIEGGFTEKTINGVMYDLQEGFANLYRTEDGDHIIRYAGQCKWVLKQP